MAWIADLAQTRNLELRIPKTEYCLDNAAMIAGLAGEKYLNNDFDDWTLSASPRLASQHGQVQV